MTSPNNLLLRLHKWAVRQDENFLTETLAHLLLHLLAHEPDAAVQIVDTLTRGIIRLKREEANLLEVKTQVSSEEGIPDIVLRTPHHMVIVEVKVESGLGYQQLRRYRRLLVQSDCQFTGLVLLTRYPSALELEAKQPDVFARWYQVADWLRHEQTVYTFQPVSKFLVDQFLEFLRARNMVMRQVTWDLPGGVRALSALADMLFEAANACGLRTQISGNQRFLGVKIDKGCYWVGVYFSEPEFLVFETVSVQVSRDAVEALGLGTVYEWTSEPGLGWYRKINLEGEDVHFFARSRVSQMQFLEGFVKECMEQAYKVIVPGGKAQQEQEQAQEDEEHP